MDKVFQLPMAGAISELKPIGIPRSAHIWRMAA